MRIRILYHMLGLQYAVISFIMHKIHIYRGFLDWFAMSDVENTTSSHPAVSIPYYTILYYTRC